MQPVQPAWQWIWQCCQASHCWVIPCFFKPCFNSPLLCKEANSLFFHSKNSNQCSQCSMPGSGPGNAARLATLGQYNPLCFNSPLLCKEAISLLFHSKNGNQCSQCSQCSQPGSGPGSAARLATAGQYNPVCFNSPLLCNEANLLFFHSKKVISAASAACLAVALAVQPGKPLLGNTMHFASTVHYCVKGQSSLFFNSKNGNQCSQASHCWAIQFNFFLLLNHHHKSF